jgi:hypothetical protein
LRSVERLNAWFWDRVSTAVSVPDASLGIFRWLFGLYLLLCEAPHFAWIDRAPRAFFNPPILSPANLFSGFPSSPFFLVLDIVILGGLLLMTIGFHTQLATAVVLAARLIGTSFNYSFGKIDHDIVVTVVLVCMLIAGWGRSYSVDARRGHTDLPDGGGPETSRRAQQGLALLGILLSFGFITAGLPKLVSWVDFNLHTSGFLSWYYPNKYELGRSLLLARFVPGTPAALLEFLDYLAPLLELSGFIALLCGRRSWRIFLLLACAFHLANVLVLNISFGAQAVSYLAFVDLRALGRVRTRVPRIGLWLAGMAGVAVIWHVATRVAHSGSSIFLVSGAATENVWGNYVAIPVLVSVITLLALDIRRCFARAPAPKTPLEPRAIVEVS